MRESFGRVRPYAERVVGIALAVVMLRSATSHAGNPFYFLSSVYSYKIVGAELGALAAAALPAVQAAIAVCLLLRWGRRGAYLASAVLFVGFTAAQTSVLNRGLDISCGCFGAADSLPVGPSTVAVAVTCAAASAVGLVLSPASPGRGGCPMRRAERAGFSLIELLVVIAILALLAGLLLGAVQRVRAAAARAQCANQLRQLTLALQQYHDANRTFPPGVSYLGGKSPQPHMTWLTRLLPHVEQDALWRQSVAAFEAEKFFEKGPHLPILGRKVALFVCPTDAVAQEPWNYGSFTVAYTSYLGVTGTDLHSWDGVLHTDAAVPIAGITDGISNTLIVGERAVSDNHNVGWWYAGWGQSKTGSTDSLLGVRERRENQDLDYCPRGPYHFRAGRADNRCDGLRFWSNHVGGANFGLADGSVRFLRYESDPLMPALGTRAGGESVSFD